MGGKIAPTKGGEEKRKKRGRKGRERRKKREEKERKRGREEKKMAISQHGQESHGENEPMEVQPLPDLVQKGEHLHANRGQSQKKMTETAHETRRKWQIAAGSSCEWLIVCEIVAVAATI